MRISDWSSDVCSSDLKVGLIGELGWGISPYISYSEAFQPVAGLNRNGVPFIPTRGRQYDGGLNWQPQRGMLLTATYYDIVEANRPTNDPANPLDTYQTGELKSKGFEFEEAMEMPGNFQLTAAYSYNDAEVTSSLYTNEVGERVYDVPQHMDPAGGAKTVTLQEDMALRVGAEERRVGKEGVSRCGSRGSPGD